MFSTAFSTVKERVDAISKNDDLSVNTKITTAKIEITGLCTLDCNFCYHRIMKDKNERQRFITDEEFEIILEHLKNEYPDIKEVGLFYMGESGLHNNIAKYYAKLKDEGYFTYLTTNGTYIKNIIGAVQFIDSLKVSWNYKDENDFVIKTNGDLKTYRQIKDNIEALYDLCGAYNKKLTVSTVLDTKREDYTEVLETLKFHDHYWIPLQTQGGTIDYGEDGVIGEDDNKVSSLPCWSLFKGLYIDADLNVRTCCYGHTDEHILYKIGGRKIEKNNYKTIQLNNKIPFICKNCLKQQKR